MSKQIRLNAFDMNCIGHIQHGMWTHPRDRSTSYNTIEYWQDLARTAERGLFDGIFLADIVGVYDVYKDSPEASILNTVQLPVNDPMLVVPVMAAVTKHIGFGVTSNLTYEPPYLFAPRIHAGSSDRRSFRVEHRHRLSGQCRARHGVGCAARP
jgi:alkanesulfonate monooxygenase SsuD/methylene tetrahydromethanopterin reductase-like flavin-dependent oxidoreductase (luciferase family)